MNEGFSPTQKRASLIVLSMLMLSTIAATQFAQSDLGYSFSITGGDSGIRFIGHDYGVDGTILLRADNADGSNLRMELGDWARGQTVTYTGAFGIVNENQYAINMTSVSVTGSGNASIYAWLHNNANTEAVSDGGTMIFDNGDGAQDFYWLLTAGNGNAADANGISTPLNAQSHTRTLIASDNAANTDHVWVQIKLIIPQSASNGQFSGTISFNFVEAEEVLAVTSPNGGESWEVGAQQNILWSGLDETADNVKLEYSKDNFNSDVNTIVASTPNDGSYAWTLPNDADDSVWVRVSDTNDATRNDTSDASFEIAASDNNLMAYWRFDETSGSTAYDDTDNNNDGTLYSGASFSSIAMANNSLDVTPDQSRVHVADDDTLEVGTGSYSFEAWFKTSDNSANKYIFKKKGTQTSETKLLVDNDAVKFKIKDNSGNYREIQHNNDYGDGEWHYVVGVVNRDDDYLYLYIDGSNAVTPLSISAVGNVSNDGTLVLGARDTSGGDEFKGLLDEIKFHNRVLSAAEISAKYTEWTKSLTVIQPNGGENIDQDSTYSIQWSSEGNIDHVKLEYSTNDFSTATTITSSTANDGSYSWSVPEIESTTVKVRVSDASDSNVNDTSDGNFTIYDG